MRRKTWPYVISVLVWLFLLDALLPGAIRAWHGTPPAVMWPPLFASLALSAFVSLLVWWGLDALARRRGLK